MVFKISMFLLEFYTSYKAVICLTQFNVPKRRVDR